MLELSILFSKDLLFLYYTQVIRRCIFLRKFNLHINFIVSFYQGMYVLDFMMYHDRQFISYPKTEKATFTKQFDLLIF